MFSNVEITAAVHRVIPSRFPTVGVFDDLADTPGEVRMLFNLEQLSNPRLNTNILPIGQPSNRLALLPDAATVSGPTATLIMAAFIHASADGGRFNDARLGAWYAALDLDTAIDETTYHMGRRLALSEGGFPNRIQMRELITFVEGPVLDICGAQVSHPDLYHPEDYTASQAFATSLRYPFSDQNVQALQYDSVRRVGGINICVFDPQALRIPIVQGDHYEYCWSPGGTVTVMKLTQVR